MWTTHYHDGHWYKFSNEHLKQGDKVYPISIGHLESKGNACDNKLMYVHDYFNYGRHSSGFPDAPHIIHDLRFSSDKAYEVLTNVGYGPVEQYFKIEEITVDQSKPGNEQLIDKDTTPALDSSAYIVSSIVNEEWREVRTAHMTYRIEEPVTLVRRKGGTTHRVIDAQGVVHCYPAPETGISVIKWKAKPGKQAVEF